MPTTNNVEIGKRLMPSIVDECAATNPQKRFCSIPNGQNARDGYHTITFAEVADAVNHMSLWIERKVGPGMNGTIAYLGENDIRYLIVFLSCNKTGYKLFLPSTKNSDEAFHHLLETTRTTALLYTPDLVEKVQRIERISSEVATMEIPSWDQMLVPKENRLPFTRSYDHEQDSCILILHTSGTTGLPKPIFLTHGFFSAFDNLTELPLPSNRTLSIPCTLLSSREIILSVTPFFHIMGFLAFVQAIFHGIPFALPPNGPLSGDLVVETLQETQARAVILPPSLIENICSTEKGLTQLSRLTYLFFGGAPLSPKIGEMLRTRVHLIPVIGSTEMGLLPSMASDGGTDWSYFEWAPGFNIIMDPVGDGLHELVIRRGKDRRVYGIFHTFPNLVEYRSKDLYIQHPTRGYLWQYSSRLDDVIVLSNGEKLNPVAMEKVIEAHPVVSRALVVGQNQFQSALLIEPNWSLWNVDNPFPRDFILNDLWPYIKEANERAPAYGQIMQNRVRIASRNKPFKITPKGTTQRRYVNEDYKEEINQIYENELSTTLKMLDDFSLDSITQWVRQVVHCQLNRLSMDDDLDLYATGFDSLQTFTLVNTLNKEIRSVEPWHSSLLKAQSIYTHPTIAKLSRYIASVLQGTVDETEVSRFDKAHHLVNLYANGFDHLEFQPASKQKDKHVVVLTGSTGSLGTYILNALLCDQTVTKIYCLNRSHDAETRQRLTHEGKGLTNWPIDDERVEFVCAQIGEDKLGLPDSKLQTLFDHVDIIIHNAWKVDFNHSIELFESLIKGVRDLLELSVRGKFRPHLIFVSSISTIKGWNLDMGGLSTPEDVIEDPQATLANGYAESKYVAERICYKASHIAGVPTTVLRVGQIAGPTQSRGKWNPSEWVPALIATSNTIGKVPRTLGAEQIQWIPVDTCADIILEIVHHRLEAQAAPIAATFHVVNPCKSSWLSLIPAIQDQHNVKTVDLSEWIQDLEQIADPTEEDFRTKPSLKLLDFYRDLLNAPHDCPDTTMQKAKDASPTLAKLRPISSTMMVNWLSQWNF